ncbi:hypothetical protein Hanom_Chr04g00330741 [Helianthus anomalus]
MNSLTSETFTRLMAKESNVSKTQAKGNEQILDESTSAPQTFVAEPTAPGDHNTKTTYVKPPPAKPKNTKTKSKKPTKPNKMGPLEDEIPEVNPRTTQMSLETTTTTSSQHVERSQPIDLTPHVSSQKEHVVNIGTPQYEAMPSFESMLKSPSPRALSLSTPLPSSPIPPTLVPLFEAIDIQTQSSPSHQHITESTTPEMTMTDPVQSAIPQTVKEVTPIEFTETLDGSSSGADTTNFESTYLNLDSSFISKAPLKATTVVATTVTTSRVGSPPNQDKEAFIFDDFESTPITKTNTTTSVDG